MVVTPSALFSLALERHRSPWNWTLHCVAFVSFALTLLFHSALLFAASLILFGVGFLDLNMPKPPENRWFSYVHRAVEWEKNWVAYPWTFWKTWRFCFTLLVAAIVIWAFWAREPIALGLLVGFGYLIKVVRENRSSGIDL